jgi:hypothetical protein
MAHPGFRKWFPTLGTDYVVAATLPPPAKAARAASPEPGGAFFGGTPGRRGNGSRRSQPTAGWRFCSFSASRRSRASWPVTASW